jgi:hypothetical protein
MREVVMDALLELQLSITRRSVRELQACAKEIPSGRLVYRETLAKRELRSESSSWSCELQ